MDENNIIGMGRKAEDIRYYAPDEEDEGNSTNSTIVDKKKERTIGKLMKTSEVEQGTVTNNDNKSKSTKKKMKGT
jgi:PBP1b-binding outer membrane lipoprotein LpoB